MAPRKRAAAGHDRPNKKKPKKDAAVTPPSRPAARETTEILEQVLTYLSPRQIVSVQRVSRTWKSVIADSPAIQEKLFFVLQQKPKGTWQLFQLRKGILDHRLENYLRPHSRKISIGTC